MQKKRNIRFKAIDLLITAISILIFSGAMYFLLKGFYGTTKRSDAKSIATVSQRNRVAQRRFSKRVIWERLQQNSEIYNEDIIRTAENSAATINFIDNTKIEILENTMVQIFFTEGGAQLSLSSGSSVNIDTTNSTGNGLVTLTFENGSVIEVDKESKFEAKSSGENISFSVKDGKAKFAGGDGHSVSVNSGESFYIAKDGNANQLPFTVTSISENYVVYRFNKKNPTVKIEWKNSNAYKNSMMIVETSTAKDFSKIKDSADFFGSNSYTIYPAEDLYYRVRLPQFPAGNNKPDIYAFNGKISVVDIENIKLISPLNNEVIAYENILKEINFVWKGNDYTEKNILQISPNKDFSNIIYSEECFGESYSEKISIDGKDNYDLYWRIISCYQGDKKIATEPRKFTLTNKQNDSSDKNIKLYSPVNNAKIKLNSDIKPVTMTWEKQDEFTTYFVEISKDESFKEDVKKSDTYTNQKNINIDKKDFSEGKWYWRVIAETSNKQEIISETNSFIVEHANNTDLNILYPPKNYVCEKEFVSNINFEWDYTDINNKSTANQNENYVVQFCKDDKFENISVEKRVKETNCDNVKLDVGKYYYRVLSGKFKSDVNEFVVVDNLKAPQIFLESEDEIVSNSDKEVKISWLPVENAQYYQVEILHDDEVIDSFETQDTNYKTLLKNDSLEQNNFSIQVQPFANETDMSTRRVGDVSNKEVVLRKPIKVSLVSPIENKKFSGLDALHNKVELVWNSVEYISDATINIYSIEQNGNKKIYKKISNANQKEILSRLPSGEYSWRVDATDIYNNVIDSEEERKFSIDVIPNLNTPKLTSPNPKKIIDANYMKRYNYINFSWNKVSGATDYNFILFKTDSSGARKEIFKRENFHDNKITITELSFFDSGMFEWSVQAFNHAYDGYLEQSSESATSSFVVSTELSSKLKLKDPGVLYGE